MYGHVITKFSRMSSLPHFFTHGAPLRALRRRELRYNAIELIFLVSSRNPLLPNYTYPLDRDLSGG